QPMQALLSRYEDSFNEFITFVEQTRIKRSIDPAIGLYVDCPTEDILVAANKIDKPEIPPARSGWYAHETNAPAFDELPDKVWQLVDPRIKLGLLYGIMKPRASLIIYTGEFGPDNYYKQKNLFHTLVYHDTNGKVVNEKQLRAFTPYRLIWVLRGDLESQRDVLLSAAYTEGTVVGYLQAPAGYSGNNRCPAILQNADAVAGPGSYYQTDMLNADY